MKYSRGDTRLFISNTGVAWQGTILEKTESRLVLAYPRAVHFGIEGMSDLTGWSGPAASYTAIEAKTGTGRLTKYQTAFLATVMAAGGRAGVARSIDDVPKILRL